MVQAMPGYNLALTSLQPVSSRSVCNSVALVPSGPAPGDYHHQGRTALGPAFSIQPPRIPAVRSTPGPGDYHLEPAPSAAPAWTLPPAAVPAPPNWNPGPGTYHDPVRHAFPRPLGSVVSSILKTAVRPDGGVSAQRFYLDSADVRKSQQRDQADAAAAARATSTGRRVAFLNGTAFRDSQDAQARRSTVAVGSVATTSAMRAGPTVGQAGSVWRG